MLGEKLRSLFRPAAPLASNGAGGLHRAPHPPHPASNGSPGGARPSNGLRQFFDNVQGVRLRILDLGGACQSNINYITSQGHKLYNDDLLLTMDRLAAQARDPEARSRLGQRFLEETLNFPEALFDGILVWDTLEFLEEELVGAVIARLQTIVRPGGTLLTFFHTQARGQAVPVYRYQIQSPDTLLLHLRFMRPLGRSFNNRHLERMFGQFRSVKFFLAKDGLREVIVTR